MRKNSFTIVLLFIISLGFASISFRDDSTIKTENQEIKYKETILGKYTSETVNAKNKRITSYNVKIFCKEGDLVAEYAIDVLNKKSDLPVEASLKTIKDRVSHNESNFINFHEETNNKKAIPQLNRVVKYLIDHKYLSI